jgi:hypothetical protein
MTQEEKYDFDKVGQGSVIIRAFGKYQRGHGHRWFVLFSGIDEIEARKRMFDFIGRTGSTLASFERYPV